MDHMALMARFNAWTNRRLYDVVATLSDDAYRRDRGAYFGSIHRTLNHVLAVDRLWTGRIAGVDRGVRALDQVLYDEFSELRAARKMEDDALVALVDGMSPPRLAAVARYARIIGEGQEEVRADHVLLTLFNHQTHHRGQVHVMLTQDGARVPPLDVVFFLHEIGLAGPPGTLL